MTLTHAEVAAAKAEAENDPGVAYADECADACATAEEAAAHVKALLDKLVGVGRDDGPKVDAARAWLARWEG